MLNESSPDQKIERTEQRIRELEIRNQGIDRQSNDLLQELRVTPAQLTAFIENPSNFTEKDWATLQRESATVNERLQIEITNISNPAKSKKTIAERNIGNHWVFVR